MKSPAPLLAALWLAACATESDRAPGPPTGRIVGGQDVTAGQAPYQVEITNADFANPAWNPKYRHPAGPKTELESHHCGGVLIAADWVLTAAHCVLEGGRPYPFSLLQVRAGSISIRARDNPDMIAFSIDGVFAAPDYRADAFVGGVQATPVHDLALAHIFPPAPLDDPTKIMPIAWPRADPGPIRALTVTGWGATDALTTRQAIAHQASNSVLDNSATLKFVVLNAIPDRAACKARLAGQLLRRRGQQAAMADLPATVLCAEAANPPAGGGKPLEGDCFGDSGGPVVARGHLDNGGGARNDLLVGVVGWSMGCAVAPSVYSKVSADADWITRTISGWPANRAKGPGG